MRARVCTNAQTAAQTAARATRYCGTNKVIWNVPRGAAVFTEAVSSRYLVHSTITHDQTVSAGYLPAK